MAPRSRPPSPDAPEAEEAGEGRDLYGEDDPLPEDLAPAAKEADDDEAESTRAGPPRKLVVIAGPDKGKVKRLSGVRIVVGRASGCHIQIDDPSISRRHMELIVAEKGVLLRDLVSGNGTKVNGERAEERLLKHEDVIEIGSSKLQFVDELEAVKKAREDADRRAEEAKKAKEEAEKKKVEDAAAAKVAAEAESAKKAEEEKKAAEEKAAKRGAWGALSKQQKIAVAGGGAVALLLMLIVFSSMFKDPGPPPPDPRQVAATKKMELARVAMADKRWADAVDLIDSAEKIKPGSDEDALGEVARKELAAQKSLDQARALLEQQRFDDALAELARTPEASAKTAEDRDALEKEITGKRLEFIEKSARDAMDALDAEGAERLIDQLPPERKKAMEARLAEVKELVQKQQKMQEEQTRQDQQQRKAHQAAARKSFVENAFRPVERKFHTKDFDRAVLECDRVQDSYRGDDDVRSRAQALKRLIPTFQRAWLDAQKKVQARAMESALKPLQKAEEIYEQIDLPGAIGDELHEQLADAEIASARAAIARGDLASAAVLYREAGKLAPGDDRAEQGMKNLAQRAGELYTEAYMMRDRDPKKSIATLKVVLEVAPKGSETYQKAQAQLRLMEP